MLRYGIVGTSNLAARYRSAIEETGGCLQAVCSRSRSRAEEFGGAGVTPYTELEDMVMDKAVDAVYLCLPNSLHAEAAVRCLQAGKHVLCEKPATLSLAELERVLLVAESTGCIFAVGVMNFFSPVMRVLRQELQEHPPVAAHLDYSQRSGKLDHIRAGGMATSFDRSLGGGVLNDLGTYPLHFAVGLFGEPERIDATARFLGDVDVTDILTLHYGSFDVVITVSKACQGIRGSEILCEGATYTLDNLSVVLGAEKHDASGMTKIDCGIPCQSWPVSDPSKLPGVQARVLRAFGRWVSGTDMGSYRRMQRETIAVQWLMDEARMQITY